MAFRSASTSLALVAAVAAVLAIAADRGGSRPASAQTTVQTATAPVERTDIVERQQVTGTLGYRGRYTLVAVAPGVVTWLPAVGSVIRRGRPAYELDLHPARLLYGARPVFRAFALGMTAGADVGELQRNLRALGYTTNLDGHFTSVTAAAVRAWQRALGETATGQLPLGSVVFAPGPMRIAATPAVTGASVGPGAAVLQATTPQPAVLLALDPATAAQLHRRDQVLISMPDGSTATARVADIARAATASDQGPTIAVTALLHHRGGVVDQAPVQAEISVGSERDVLAVPIAALLARPGGGYAVQVGSRLVPVSVGIFDDVSGLVAVSGALATTDRVEVPAG
jgi:peptidoglycan hydrolase-like protein with peptidoglycan-binding domain